MNTSSLDHTVSAGHAAPTLHIPESVGEIIPNWSIWPLNITTTVFSTWIFMVLLFIIVGIFYTAITTNSLPTIRAMGLDIVARINSFLENAVGNRKYTRLYFPMLAGFGVFILLSNIFGLILDYLVLVIPHWHHYLRPFNSDMSTTLALAATVIIVAQMASMWNKWFFNHWKHYIFNFTGNSVFEKILNVPIGWIHFVSEMMRMLSLSVRLFANIFAGVAMIGVMVYLGSLIPLGPLGQILTLPIWFFELLVAGIQAFIFTMLSAMYIKEAITHDQH